MDLALTWIVVGAKVKPQTMRMRRALRIGLISLGVLVGSFVVVGAGGYFFLRSSAGSRFILKQLSSQLKSNAGITMTYESAAIDPFSHIQFRNLMLLQQAPEGRMETKVTAIDIVYRISLLSRRVDVQKVHVQSPQVFYHWNQPTVPLGKTETSDGTSGKPMKISDIEEQILSPWVSVSIKDVSISGVSLDIDYRDPASAMVAKVSEGLLKANAEFLPASLMASGEFNSGEKSYLSLAQTKEKNVSKISLSPVASAKWNLGLRRERDAWLYDMQPSSGHFETKEFLSIREGETVSTTTINGVKADVDGHFLIRSQSLFPLDPNAIQTLDVKKTVAVGAARIESREGKKTNVTSFDSATARFTASLPKDVECHGYVELQNLFTPDVVRPVPLVLKSELGLAQDFSKVNLLAHGLLAEIPWMQIEMTSQADTDLKADGKAVFFSQERLFSLLKKSGDIKALGQLQTLLRYEGALGGKAHPLFVTKREPADAMNAEGDLTLEISQQKRGRKPTAEAPVAFEPIKLMTHLKRTEKDFSFTLKGVTSLVRVMANRAEAVTMSLAGSFADEEIRFEAQLNSPRVNGSTLKRPWPVDLQTKALWRAEEKTLKADGKIQVEKETAFDYALSATTTDGKTEGKFQLNSLLGDYLANIRTKQSPSDYGSWRLNSDLTFAVEPPKGNLTFMEAGAFSTKGATKVSQERVPQSTAVTGMIKDPVLLSHDIQMKQGGLVAELSAQAPLVDIQKTAKLVDTRFSTKLRVANLASAKEGELTVSLTQDKVILAPEMSPSTPSFAGLNAQLEGSLHQGSILTIKTLSADFNKSMVKLVADANGKLKESEILMQGVVTVKVPKDFPEIAGQSIQGEMALPWRVSVLGGRDINFEGDLDVKNFSWKKDALHVSGVSGKVPVSEKLVFDKEQIGFAYLLRQNPFERVDYEKLRPLLQGAYQMRIEEVGFEEKKYGPFIGFFSVDQNMIFAHRFDMTLGSTGRAYGEMSFNVHPSNLQMGFLTRLTALNLEEILPKKYLTNIPKGDKNISGRTGIVVNLNNSTVEGRVDITEIGGAQLILMLNVLDPDYEDEKLNNARSALGLGYPTFVEMDFHQGYLDLGMEVSVLGISQKLNVRSVPISTLLGSATSDLVKKTQEGPLK